MTAHEYSPPIPLHVTPPPDSDARREAHIREAVAKIPAPPFASSDRVLLEHVANRIYAIEIDLVHIRVGNQRAEDHNQSALVILASRMDMLGDTIAGLGRHVEQRDSVSNEAQLETAARVESARRVATEAKDAASGVRVDVDELKRLSSQERWAQRGKVGTAIGTAIGALEAIARLSGQDGVIGLVTKMFGGH